MKSFNKYVSENQVYSVLDELLEESEEEILWEYNKTTNIFESLCKLNLSDDVHLVKEHVVTGSKSIIPHSNSDIINALLTSNESCTEKWNIVKHPVKQNQLIFYRNGYVYKKVLKLTIEEDTSISIALYRDIKKYAKYLIHCYTIDDFKETLDALDIKDETIGKITKSMKAKQTKLCHPQLVIPQ